MPPSSVASQQMSQEVVSIAGPSSEGKRSASPSPSTTISAGLLQAGSAPEPLQPCSAEGDRSGLAYTPDGHLLIGGLAVDGSAMGESGWATPFPGESANRAPLLSSGRRFSQVKQSPSQLQGQQRHRGGKGLTTQSFERCIPAEGPATFGARSRTLSPEHKHADIETLTLSGTDAVVETSGKHSRRWKSWLRTKRGKGRPEDGVVADQPSMVTLADIVGGRTCRPISLNDLKIYLAKRHDVEETASSLPPVISTPSFPLHNLTDMDVHSTHSVDQALSQSTPGEDFDTLSNVPTKGKTAGVSFGAPPSRNVQSQSSGEADALAFIVAYDRYARQYRSAVSQQHRRSFPVSTPAVVPHALQERFHALVDKYIGCIPSYVLPTPPSIARSRSSSAATKGDKVKTPTSAAARNQCLSRLQWMVELGLLDEALVSDTLKRAETSIDPEVLLPLVNCVVNYIETYVIPAFLEDASRNLGKGTSHGRLYSGLGCTAIALVLSVLLILDPSPLTGSKISRWYRLLTFPLWAAGIGFILAAYTGVCMWLSLRGNRDVTGEEKNVENLLSIEEGEDPETRARADNSQWMMAPEVWKVLGYFLPQKVLDTVGNGNGSRKERKSTGSKIDILSSEAIRQEQEGEQVAMVTENGDPSILSQSQPRKPLTPVDEKSEQIGSTTTTSTSTTTSSATAHDPRPATKTASSAPLAEPLPGQVKTAATISSPRLVSKSISIIPGVEVGLRAVTTGPVTVLGMGDQATSPSLGGKKGSSSPFMSATSSATNRARAHSGATTGSTTSRPVSLFVLEDTQGQNHGLGSPPFGQTGAVACSVEREVDSGMETTTTTATTTTIGAGGGSVSFSPTIPSGFNSSSAPGGISLPHPPPLSMLGTRSPTSSTSIPITPSGLERGDLPLPLSLSPHKRRPRRSGLRRLLDTAQTSLGLSVSTERVRDERIRRIHLWRAIKALAIDCALSTVVIIVVVAIP